MTNKEALDKVLSYIDHNMLYRDLELNEAVQTLSDEIEPKALNMFTNLYLNCEKIILTQKGLDVTVELNGDMGKVETLKINGVKFVKAAE